MALSNWWQQSWAVWFAALSAWELWVFHKYQFKGKSPLWERGHFFHCFTAGEAEIKHQPEFLCVKAGFLLLLDLTWAKPDYSPQSFAQVIGADSQAAVCAHPLSSPLPWPGSNSTSLKGQRQKKCPESDGRGDPLLAGWFSPALE